MKPVSQSICNQSLSAHTAIAILIAMMCAILSATSHAAMKDPLDFPATKVGNLAGRPMLAAVRAGDRLIAAGSRGVVIFSDDNGLSWNQSAVPVQSDLVAVYFPTQTHGWAAGHDGVILHSSDGGKSWEKQFDGRLALDTFVQYYRAKANSGDGVYQTALAAVEKNYSTGPSLPCLDVWFKDSTTGYAVGSFGTLSATNDGGRTWEPWLERIDNKDMLNLNAVRGINGQVYIAAERGIVFKLDEKSGRFKKVETGYGGSFFGIVGSEKVLLAYGLRGSAYRSVDGGETWEAVTMPSETTISSGLYDEKAGEFVLANVAGELVVGDATGSRFVLRKGQPGSRYSGIVAISDKKYLITSLDGTHVHAEQ